MLKHETCLNILLRVVCFDFMFVSFRMPFPRGPHSTLLPVAQGSGVFSSFVFGVRSVSGSHPTDDETSPLLLAGWKPQSLMRSETTTKGDHPGGSSHKFYKKSPLPHVQSIQIIPKLQCFCCKRAAVAKMHEMHCLVAAWPQNSASQIVSMEGFCELSYLASQLEILQDASLQFFYVTNICKSTSLSMY